MRERATGPGAGEARSAGRGGQNICSLSQSPNAPRWGPGAGERGGGGHLRPGRPDRQPHLRRGHRPAVGAGGAVPCFGSAACRPAHSRPSVTKIAANLKTTIYEDVLLCALLYLLDLMQSPARPPALHAAAASSAMRPGRAARPRRAPHSGTEAREADATCILGGIGYRVGAGYYPYMGGPARERRARAGVHHADRDRLWRGRAGGRGAGRSRAARGACRAAAAAAAGEVREGAPAC